MGYYTRHKLTVHAPQGVSIDEMAIMAELQNKKNTPERDAELVQMLKNKSPKAGDIIADLRKTYPDAAHALTEKGNSNNDTKWYDHEQHLRDFSLKYPGILFELHGEGEEAKDLWKQYYKDGKLQTCKAHLTYPQFDEKKLK